ncbi:hypothetical protein [Halobacterium wangiae]|uniref:hypothetical protein n=1 Tax=Halobacterium wangiae TaxID=2902623 RepID=UPI001E4C2544|nr:hypothetical protein [Halobacterium wangiae]
MDCVVCRKRSGYNRVVVDTESGHELGGLCVRCETEKFGELGDELGDSGTECALCDRDGFWAVPKWLPSTYESEGKTVSYVDYDVSASTLRLCDEHLARLGVKDITIPEDATASEEFITRGAED